MEMDGHNDGNDAVARHVRDTDAKTESLKR
jgi:hypothetical protein